MAEKRIPLKRIPLKRIPLWLTVVPLAVGIAGYFAIWTGFRDTLAADIAAVLPGSKPRIGGFPYRIEADLAGVQARLDGPGLRAQAMGESVVVNRGPWRDQLTIISVRGARLTAEVLPIAGATLRITAPAAQVSLHLIPALPANRPRIARLSAVFETPAIDFGLLPTNVTADHFEVHLREKPARAAPRAAGNAPTPPSQVQLVLAGQKVRFGNGDPLTLAADFALTAPRPVHSYADWRPQGTVELRSLTLSDATGAVLSAELTAVPAPGGLRLAGTFTTVCPATVRAAFAGAPPPSELRTRMPVQFAFGTTPGAPLRLTPEGGEGPRATRGQQPPCPALRR